MCRWVAYVGEPIFLEDILVKPSHSLLRQSRFAEENIIQNNPVIPDGPFPTNDDGFGMGWYGLREHPGLYRDLRPAWNDRNYLTIASQIKSGLFMSHIRAAYNGLVQISNCHPFRYKNWLFQHNGEIDDFEMLKRDIMLAINPELFNLIEGTTDSEVFFYLTLSMGLEKSPKQAIEKSIQFIEELKIKKNISSPFKLTACFSDGTQLYSVRYANSGQQKSLYINKDHQVFSCSESDFSLPKNAKLLVSEPLTKFRENWEKIDESCLVIANKSNDYEVIPLNL